jgi:hypothetical protein
MQVDWVSLDIGNLLRQSGVGDAENRSSRSITSCVYSFDPYVEIIHRARAPHDGGGSPAWATVAVDGGGDLNIIPAANRPCRKRLSNELLA